jgi:hypothetical protein
VFARVEESVSDDRVQETLEDAGILWLTDYMSCDACHEEYGVEFGRIWDYQTVQEVPRVLRRTFPDRKLNCI